MSTLREHQTGLRLQPAPRAQTVEHLVRIFGDVLVPLDALRERWFRNLNRDNFSKAVRDGRIALPITTLDDSAKAHQYVEVHQLAAFLEQRAYLADQDLAQRLQPQPGSAES
ncbi:TPA: pyocin activator PrtN family protein [Pseudomonas aeruginosa]|nr:pyocin activator PrtN family protein [Pseudomonas aeruginosa]